MYTYTHTYFTGLRCPDGSTCLISESTVRDGHLLAILHQASRVLPSVDGHVLVLLGYCLAELKHGPLEVSERPAALRHVLIDLHREDATSTTVGATSTTVDATSTTVDATALWWMRPALWWMQPALRWLITQHNTATRYSRHLHTIHHMQLTAAAALCISSSKPLMTPISLLDFCTVSVRSLTASLTSSPASSTSLWDRDCREK